MTHEQLQDVALVAPAFIGTPLPGVVVSKKQVPAEVRSTAASGARKGVKDVRPDLIPAKAHIELARHYSEGAAKYTEYDDDGNIIHDGSNNWRLGYEWSKSIAALERHLLAFKNGEDYDEPWPNGHPGSKHVIAVAWHALALATYMDEHPELDDRWSTAVRAKSA